MSDDQYRKKPVVITARRLTVENAHELSIWANAAYQLLPQEDAEPCLFIPTLEGKMIAWVGDYIIQGVAGEFYPCQPDIFAMTYEKV